MDIVSLVIAMSIPSAVTGFCFWLIEQKIQKRDKRAEDMQKKREKEMDEREAAREKSELYILKSVRASISLGEATARAVQRIPDAHCNGEMHAALEYAKKVKHEQKDFLDEQALKNLY